MNIVLPGENDLQLFAALNIQFLCVKVLKLPDELK